jgi:hypothetical protein
VFSVSLDSDVARWEAAIDQDELSWKWHVSDLKRWQSEAAAMYWGQFNSHEFPHR